jgi:hypothetical protein
MTDDASDVTLGSEEDDSARGGVCVDPEVFLQNPTDEENWPRGYRWVERSTSKTTRVANYDAGGSYGVRAAAQGDNGTQGASGGWSSFNRGAAVILWR